MMRTWQEPTAVDEGMILMLWKRGYDTMAIAQRLGCKESEIYNRLLHVREAGR